jgi:PhnB protein
MSVKPIPEGYHTITPYQTVKAALQAMDFLKNAFGAAELTREGDPQGHFVANSRSAIR